MSLLHRIGILSGFSLCLGLSAAACSGDDGDDPPQCAVQPAFDLTVNAVSGALPADTEILVEYGGAKESYRLDTGDAGQEVVLCKEHGTDGGDAGKAVTSVTCKLWTQATSTVTVSGGGFPTVTEDLKPKYDDDKCLETVPVSIALGDLDAGS